MDTIVAIINALPDAVRMLPWVFDLIEATAEALDALPYVGVELFEDGSLIVYAE